jgi:topoisomerase-4 subunit B
MTFFYREMPELIEAGRLYLAQPPLYRLSQGGQTTYARDDKHKDELLEKQFNGRGKVEISRFKGLGEMPARQLKETTMDKAKRTLLRVTLTDAKAAAEAAKTQRKEAESLVERLMGRKPELRYAFIQENAKFVSELDI